MTLLQVGKKPIHTNVKNLDDVRRSLQLLDTQLKGLSTELTLDYIVEGGTIVVAPTVGTNNVVPKWSTAGLNNLVDSNITDTGSVVHITSGVDVGFGTATPRGIFEISAPSNTPFILKSTRSAPNDSGISLSAHLPTIGFNMYHDGSTWRSLAAGYTALLNQHTATTGQVNFAIRNVNAAAAEQDMGDYLTAGDQHLVILPTGEVGLGTETPSVKLDVVGSTDISVDLDVGGDLTVGQYLVPNNDYAFQSQSFPSAGLFFNATNTRFEFRDQTAAPVFSVALTTGTVVLRGTARSIIADVDTTIVKVAGGNTALASSGATISLYGNTHANTGDMVLETGDAATATFALNVAGALAFSIAATGNAAFAQDVNILVDLDVAGDAVVDGTLAIGGAIENTLTVVDSNATAIPVNQSATTGATALLSNLSATGVFSALSFRVRSTNRALASIGLEWKSSAGDLYFYQRSGSATGRETMRLVGSSGNVGVATVIPATKFQVVGDTRFGDQATNYAAFAADGELTLVGTARAQQHIKLFASTATLGATAPSVGTVGNFKVLGFSTSGPTETVYMTFQVPEEWDSTTDMSIHVHWAPADTGSGAVKWDMAYSPVASNASEVISGAGTALTVTDAVISAPAQDELHESPDATILAANIESEDVIGIALSRDTTVGGDYGGTANFIFLEIEFIRNSLGFST